MNTTYTEYTCATSPLSSVRLFGVIYFALLIIFGTIGNILSLLVIQGVGQSTKRESRRLLVESSKRILENIPEASNGQERHSASSSLSTDDTPATTPVDKPNHRLKLRTSQLSVLDEQVKPARTYEPIRTAAVKRQPNRSHPSRLIFTALAVADTIVLWINPPRYWIDFVFGFDIRQHAGVVMCRLHTFLTYATRDAAVWVLCLLTFERYLIAVIPHRAKVIWRGKRKMFAWLIIFSLILAKNSILLFILSLFQITAQEAEKYEYESDLNYPNYFPPNSTMQEAKSRTRVADEHIGNLNRVICDSKELIPRKVFFYIDIAVYSIIPTILLLFLNVGLFRVIHKTGKLRRRYTSEYKTSIASVDEKRPVTPSKSSTQWLLRAHNASSNAKKHDIAMHPHVVRSSSVTVKRSVIQANRLLIPVSLFHLVTSIPICIFSIVEDSLQLKRSPSPQVRCIVNACGYLFVMLGTMTYGINCFIYFLSSKQFRGRLYALTSKICATESGPTSGTWELDYMDSLRRKEAAKQRTESLVSKT
ncbi:unnamed protein product [Dibothriocephalus latus]|uniref:G-protein coupled receptors family 1 profile domain-containing protein n=1 Tax=Dibothriocephalus latus TaxID=60516 RepID=A0A3P7L3C5_DIBLA|nr:unnamed protein product [Dibothriocephalus latus]